MKLLSKFLLSILLLFVFSAPALANFLEGDNKLNTKQSAGSGGKHLDIYDTGTNRQCFDINYNKGYADFLLNPYLANNNRGDWGEI